MFYIFILVFQDRPKQTCTNEASILLFLANILPDSDERKQKYIEFGESQLNYILGDNPLHINFVVRTEENSPKSVRHKDVHLLMM